MGRVCTLGRTWLAGHSADCGLSYQPLSPQLPRRRRKKDEAGIDKFEIYQNTFLKTDFGGIQTFFYFKTLGE